MSFCVLRKDDKHEQDHKKDRRHYNRRGGCGLSEKLPSGKSASDIFKSDKNRYYLETNASGEAKFTQLTYSDEEGNTKTCEDDFT